MLFFPLHPPIFGVIKLLIKSYSIDECTSNWIRCFKKTSLTHTFVRHKIHASEENQFPEKYPILPTTAQYTDVCIYCTFLFIIPFQCVVAAPHNKYLKRLLPIAHQNTMWKGFVWKITKIFAGRRLDKINDLNTYRLTGYFMIITIDMVASKHLSIWNGAQKSV